jgi:hypothetical protein
VRGKIKVQSSEFRVQSEGVVEVVEGFYEFGVGVVEVGGEAEEFGAVGGGAEGGDDTGGGQVTVEFDEAGGGSVGGEDGAGVGGRGVGIEDLEAAILESGSEPGAFAEEFGGDEVGLKFEDEVEGGVEAGDAEEVGAARFVAAGVGFEGEVGLGEVVGAIEVMPAVGGGLEDELEVFPDVENAGGTGAEQPLMGVGGEEIDRLDVHGEGAEGLDGVETEPDASFTEGASEGGVVEAPTGEVVCGGEGDEAGAGVDLIEDVGDLDLAEGGGLEASDFDAARGLGHPRVDVGGVIVVVDEDVIAWGEREAVGDKAEGV